ncbi:MAG: tRNA (guanosine(37)-N1)-methyltransferase TrmD [Treponema sp.]|jgi:tRNA (guanine37-N1)-methyltransferase|nr:tRNA (guanosine(37)-N1)-methyltransferase TrmD [Treponema sp.]
MKYTVLSLFPEICDAYFASSIMAKAVKSGIIEYCAINIRDHAFDKHRTCDDSPYGGGAGMLMLAEPLGKALVAAGKQPRSLENNSCSPYTIYLSPSGRPFSQSVAKELIAHKELILICGRYEGIDQRIIDTYVDDEISVGDYVLSSGEVAALILIDSTYRLLEQVITPASLVEESFSDGLLEYPQYTRPEVYDTMRVPEVLLSGHHENIRRWRLEKRVEKTLAVRQDLIRAGEERCLFDEETRKIIERKRREKDGEGER